MAELVFFPSFCKICGRLLTGRRDRIICGGCRDRIEPRPPVECPVCGRFFDGAGARHLCGRCQTVLPPFSRHCSGGRYRGVLKDAVLLLKYRKIRPLGAYLGGLVSAAVQKDEDLWRGVDLVVPVPLHRDRRRERGFNQSERIGREIARRAGLPIDGGVLLKVRSTPPQTSLEHGARTENVRGAYALGRKKSIEGKILLLVDDVFTTGSTLGECARVLRSAGAADVRAVTVAQA